MIPHLILAQSIVTAISSGCNALYFLRYRSTVRRRRVGALALGLLSAALLMESLYFSGYALLQGNDCGGLLAEAGYWLAARSLVCIGSLLMSTLILRQQMAKRG